MPHPSACPYPYYGDVPRLVDEWQRASDERAEHLASERELAGLDGFGEVFALAAAERAALLVRLVHRHLLDAYTAGEVVTDAGEILDHLREVRKVSRESMTYAQAFEFENATPAPWP
jgi:hypothetical protein